MAVPATMPGTTSGSTSSVLSASRPTNLRRARARLAGMPSRSPPIIAAMPIWRLVRSPLTKLFWAKRGMADALDRREHLAAQQNHAALIDLKLTEEIAAVADLDAMPLAELERPQPTVDDELVLREHVFAHPELARPLLHRVIS